MQLGKRQFSIGKLIYITLFVATLVAMSQAPVPWAFVYPAAFVFIISIYVIWIVTRPLPDIEDSILDEWDDDQQRRENDDD